VVQLADPTEEQSRRQRRHYLANVTQIEEQLGLIIDALEARGVLDDTVIIFTSDQGQLFDLGQDPDEKRTLWDAVPDSEAGQAKTRLATVIHRWRARSVVHTAGFGREHR
jgi:arylsulfatase A-like enzyme